jgi:hypothetical protein
VACGGDPGPKRQALGAEGRNYGATARGPSPRRESAAPLGLLHGSGEEAEELMTAPKRKKSCAPRFLAQPRRSVGSGRGAEGRNDGAPALSFPLAKPLRGEGSDDSMTVALPG